MAIIASGPISMSAVFNETNQAGKGENYSLARLSLGDWDNTNYYTGYAGIDQNSTSKPNRAAQHGLAEFYSYNHSQNGSCSGTSFSDAISSNSDRRWSYHRINVTGAAGNIVVITVVEPPSQGAPFADNGGGYYYIFNTYPFDTSGTLLVTNALYYGKTISTSTSSQTVTYRYTMTSSSEVIYIVVYAYEVVA